MTPPAKDPGRPASTRKSRQAGADRRRRQAERNALRPAALEGQRLDERRTEIDMRFAPPTAAQIWTLRHHGLPVPLTRHVASRAIDALHRTASTD